MMEQIIFIVLLIGLNIVLMMKRNVPILGIAVAILSFFFCAVVFLGDATVPVYYTFFLLVLSAISVYVNAKGA